MGTGPSKVSCTFVVPAPFHVIIETFNAYDDAMVFPYSETEVHGPNGSCVVYALRTNQPFPGFKFRARAFWGGEKGWVQSDVGLTDDFKKPGTEKDPVIVLTPQMIETWPKYRTAAEAYGD